MKGNGVVFLISMLVKVAIDLACMHVYFAGSRVDRRLANSGAHSFSLSSSLFLSRNQKLTTRPTARPRPTSATHYGQ